MTYQELEIKRSYVSVGQENIAKSFLTPVLKCTKSYKRSVGFFSSSVLQPIVDGIVALARNNGKIQLIASPNLTEDDIQAISTGYEAREKVINASFTRDFMKELEQSCQNPNTYRGELYLELHRGTLTNQHTIKRNNRKAEFALRDLEIATVMDSVKNNKAADSAEIAPLYETLLINQFHDSLPGTCINRAHEESREQTTALIKEAKEKF